MLEDIGNHFSDRIVDLIVDTLDSCNRMDVPYRDAKTMVASIMAAHLAETCTVFRMSQEDFLKLAEVAYQRHTGAQRKAPRRTQ
jgi:argininosuccinate lyase